MGNDPADPRARRRALHVLVVDDSAVVRQVLTALLVRSAGATVDVAADPLIALEKMRKRRPDVIVLDLDMPRMDGLSFLRRVMTDDPVPVVICSALTGAGTEAAIRAAEAGAVEIVTKPRTGLQEFLNESAVVLVDAVRGAARARLRPGAALRAAEDRPAGGRVSPCGPAPLRSARETVVVMGASTGGTEALRVVLEAMPPEAPGLVVVQHMPEGFTGAFANRLNQFCRIEVKEAAPGDRVTPGRALVAPGNRHTLLVRSGAGYEVDVVDGPLVSRHRPSVDVLFRSAAQAAGPNGVGVILTGMGDDGAEGLLEMRRAGAFTVAQDEATCVVFGMPREAIGHGAVDEVLPIARIPDAILWRAGSSPSSPRPSGRRRSGP